MILKRDNVEQEVTSELDIAELISQGFSPIDNQEPQDEGLVMSDYNQMKVPELVKLAQAKGIEGAQNLKKAELIAVLQDTEKGEPQDEGLSKTEGTEEA